jgi:hypothetical protein
MNAKQQKSWGPFLAPHVLTPLKPRPNARTGRFTGRERGIGRGYRRTDVRVGEVGLHMRDAKQQNLGSISSTLMSSPISNDMQPGLRYYSSMPHAAVLDCDGLPAYHAFCA